MHLIHHCIIHFIGAKREKSLVRKRCLRGIAGNKAFRPEALEVATKEAFYAREIADNKVFCAGNFW